MLERDRLDESSTDAGLETAEKADVTEREAERAKVTAKVKAKVKLEVVRASKGRRRRRKKKKSRRFFFSQSGKKRKGKWYVRA